MTVPEKALRELTASLEAQQDLVAEVRSLRTSNQRLTMLVVIGFAVFGLAAIGMIRAYAASNEASEASRLADAAVAEIQNDRAAATLVACQLRNNIQRSQRNAADETDARIDAILLDLGVEPETVERFDITAAALYPPADETDRDCNDDGTLNAADYPPETSDDD